MRENHEHDIQMMCQLTQGKCQNAVSCSLACTPPMESWMGMTTFACAAAAALMPSTANGREISYILGKCRQRLHSLKTQRRNIVLRPASL